jgi:light-regulated signal transduction histidine kinase (bacteriophytochrome)
MHFSGVRSRRPAYPEPPGWAKPSRGPSPWSFRSTATGSPWRSTRPPPHAPWPSTPAVQVLVNLLQNARDAAAGGPVRVAATVTAESLVVTVEDDGPGLSPEAAAHLFEPFFTTKPPGQGTGLGLYTSYALAGGMGGRVSLENRAAGGVTARLLLPARGELSAPSSAAPASR